MSLDYNLWQQHDPLALFKAVKAELEKPENAALKSAVEQGAISYDEVPTILMQQMQPTQEMRNEH